MKNFTYFLLIGISLFAISCSKKDSVEKNSLAGTSWTLRANTSNYLTLKFLDETDVKIIESWGASEKYTYEGSYTYNKPNVRISYYDDDYELEVKVKGEVSGDKMTVTFDYGDEGEVDYILTKD